MLLLGGNSRRAGLVTCEDLTEAGKVEETPLGHGEQLAQEHQEGNGGEDHRQNHQHLHGLEPI